MTLEIPDSNSNGGKSSSVDFYLPDISLRDFPLSTKRSFLLLVEQALKTASEAIEFAINADGKSHIALLNRGRNLPIVTISPGIFDRYWDFLVIALKSPFGLKTISGNLIYELIGEPMQTLSGRKITIHLSAPKQKEDYEENLKK